MLERAPSCLEPASQLFLRGIDPPLRTHRVLGPSFWRNGGNELAVPAWWPLYLAKVRRLSQDPKLFRRRRDAFGALPVTEQAERSRLVRPHASLQDPTLSQQPTRYSKRYASQARQERTRPDNAPPHVGIVVRESTSVSRAAHDTSSTPQHAFYAHRGLPSDSTVSNIEERLRTLLDGHEIEDATQETGGIDKADTIWSLFIQLPNHESYASSVFHSLASDYAPKRSKQTMWAFDAISVSQRSAGDYNAAVRVALKMDDFRLSLSINAEATARSLNSDCSPFLLLHFTSHMLWSNAVRVWTASFRPLSAGKALSFDTIRQSLLSQVDNYRELPHAIDQLATQLLGRSLITMHLAGTLALIGRELLTVLLRSGRLMSSITPKGLLGILNKYKALLLLKPTMYVDAVDTLLKSANRSDKSGLGTMLYRHFRLTFPEAKPSRGLLGALLSIHASETAPSKAYNFYLREFASHYGVADDRSYQLVLTSLAARGDVVGVKTVFQQLCQAHSPPKTLEYYNPLIYVHARLGDVEGAQHQFERLKDFGMVADTYSWNILMYAHARSTRPEGVVEVYEKMKAAGVPADRYTFGTLMSISSSVGDTDAVLRVIDQAQQSNVEGSYEMISGLIQSYLLNNQPDTAERLAEATSEANLRGSPVTMWNYILRHYAFRKDSDAVLRVQQRMRSMGIQPDDMTYAALMTALVVIGKTNDATRILRRLNLSQQLVATPFHYAVVLYGYVLEDNRDMANVIYQEMMERFSDIGASPRLAMLHLQARRSLNSNESPHFAADYLAEIMHSITTADRATKRPQPGLHRRGALRAVPSIYMEQLVKILLAKGRVSQANKLVQRYESLAETSFLHLDANAEDSIHWLATRVQVASMNADWATVDELWRQIIQQAMQIATPSSAKDRQELGTGHIDDGKKVAAAKAGEPSSIPRSSHIGIELPVTGPDFEFDTMIPSLSNRGKPSAASLLDRPGLKIIPAQRFLLASALNPYLRALDLRQEHASAIELVRQLQSMGFTLTSQNWNFYIQVLARSSEQEHWIEAFRVFEEKMLPNTPSWRVLRRGRWQSSDSAEETKTFRRRDVEKTDPDLLVPTYLTPIYLATVLKKSAVLSHRENRTFVSTLLKVARGTCRYVRAIPHFKDRFQGVLLRGRQLFGDLPKRPRDLGKPDRSGVLGSRSPLDHVPPSENERLENLVARKSANEPHSLQRRAEDIQLAERLEGQLHRAPAVIEKFYRSEDDEEVEKRVERQEGGLLKTMDQIRRDRQRPSMVSDEWFGHPSARTKGNVGRTRRPRSGALFDPKYLRIERQAQAEKERNQRLDESLQNAARGERGETVTAVKQTRKIRGAAKDDSTSHAVRRLQGSPSPSVDGFEKDAHIPERLLQIRKLPQKDPHVKQDRKKAVKRRLQDVDGGGKSKAKDKNGTTRVSLSQRGT